ncbi:MAG TPA: carbohydrate-binding protein [Herpetosiphonaceae bacterium]
MLLTKRSLWRWWTLATLSMMLVAAAFGQAMPTFAQTGSNPDARLDLTGNLLIDDADAASVIESWRSAYELGPCSAALQTDHDLDGNGCVDVGDVQAVFAQWGTRTSSSAPVAEADPAATTYSEAFYTVNSAGNDNDADTSDGLCRTAGNTCTLRAALTQANTRLGPETITFNIRNADGSCPALVTIEAPPGASGFRIEDKSGRVVLDGYTQCGASPNTLAVGGNAVIKIELKGNRTIDVNGLSIYSSGNIVRGLAIYNWDFQIKLLYGAAKDNRIEGNFLGTNASNSFQYETSSPFGENHHEGVRIQGGGDGPARNIIGGTTPDKRNIISGNRKDGLKIQGAGARENRIIGNYIGLKQDGATPLRNYSDGVDFEFGVKSNWLGGTTVGERNVISGNFSEGIEISHDPGTQYNSVVGNYFGLTADGRRAASYGNSETGISFEDAVDSNYAYNNVIGGNGTSGIFFFILGTNNEVYNNKIGVAADGSTPVPNGYQTSFDGRTPPYYERNGITIMGGSQRNKIHHNLIAHHPGDGIVLKNTSDAAHNHFGETYYNTISQNSLFNNGDPSVSESGAIDGVWLKPYYVNGAWTYPNQGLPAPTLTSATTSGVRGAARTRSNQACAGCTIEVFIADKPSLTDPSGDNAGEGKTFIGSGTTDASGSFAFSVSGVAQGQLVTATATDTLGNTSQFSSNVAVAAGSNRIALPGRFEVEDYNPGGEGVGYHDTTAGNSGGKYRADDVDIQTTTDTTGSFNVGYIVAGEWLAYDVNVTTAGSYRFTVRAATPYSGRSLHIEIDGVNVTGPLAVPQTGGWQTWTNVVSSPVSLTAGPHTLRIAADTSSFNLNYVQVGAP